MLNYFNYFTEIETRFQQRRGTLLLLSTLDWALIEMWREAGVPLEAVLQGIDDAFDKYDQRSQKTAGRVRKVNGLAWCAQAVMAATEDMRDAAVGAAKPAVSEEESGFQPQRIAAYLRQNAAAVASQPDDAFLSLAERLRALADEVETELAPSTEDLELTLTALEERMFAALMLSATEEEVVALRAQAARELAPYRGKMSAVQLKQVTEQFVHKRLMEARGVPRLSLFYMSVE
ncbi:hypothetical protein [Terriglobus roseus]|uniref:Uncharacterized protein n=1 Tax=Terriglobus roseus TaxID=392734 RepID=A0A1G7LT41_9BACT|nr:hypothetical protein [Terriglobus roseus]SDF52129.1 hypothetical protein SAMN05444167_2610 [Terriglobus roseus]